jgi:hypothetical protein
MLFVLGTGCSKYIHINCIFYIATRKHNIEQAGLRSLDALGSHVVDNYGTA